MTVLFGHPSGGPFSHHAALAHFAAGRLEAFCVPWMPSASTVHALDRIAPIRSMAQRFGRRHFSQLAGAPTIQGKTAECVRLVSRLMGASGERAAYQANDWLMETMRRECRRANVSAVHAYEDCSLWQFEEAKSRGQACLYDMPIGYYEAWQQTEMRLARKYAEWLPQAGLPSSRYVRPAQKRREMELADLVLAPSTFAVDTIREFFPGKAVARAPYGVDLDFWRPGNGVRDEGPLRFIYAGQISIRKGLPLLLEAWRAAALRDATLELVGAWQLAEHKRRTLPPGVGWTAPCSRESLRERYLASDVFLFPSFFEGFGLVLLEALACGLPVITTFATAGPDVLTPECSRLVATGELEPLVESLRWFGNARGRLNDFRLAARRQAERWTWEGYRRAVDEAVTKFV